jgi:malonyl CoA-acyl carrier protein transacylase
MGRAECAELRADLEATYRDAGPKRAVAVADRWAEWYPRYVRSLAEKYLLELHPDSECARKAQSKVLNRRSRLIDGAVSVLWKLERSPRGLATSRAANLVAGMGMSHKKFWASVSLLEAAGAIRRLDGGERLVATLSSGLVRDALVMLDASLIDRIEATSCMVQLDRD